MVKSVQKNCFKFCMILKAFWQHEIGCEQGVIRIGGVEHVLKSRVMADVHSENFLGS